MHYIAPSGLNLTLAASQAETDVETGRQLKPRPKRRTARRQIILQDVVGWESIVLYHRKRRIIGRGAIVFSLLDSTTARVLTSRT